MGSRCAVPAVTVVHIGVTFPGVCRSKSCLFVEWQLAFFQWVKELQDVMVLFASLLSWSWRTNSWNCALCMDTVTWRCAVPADHPTLTQYILQTLHNWLHSCGIAIVYSVGQSLPSRTEVDWLVRLVATIPILSDTMLLVRVQQF